ncbi:hypothetical protein F1D05_17915 [Kribbella qitaiheensis]|uniref:Uncharacterized protein n=1 Tax=Kribbella qitaiheensis TaxID=1544730 RepID=A0A7G6WZN0_9ACTN|nr:hypothetical protein [Kribbella qitaiheensis]QNE19445.1 hypothetical protein F1D05_17915 [Kribbella qitaiheensis]
MRVVAAVVTVVYCVLLIPDHELRDVVKTVGLAPLYLVFAIEPRGLFDGRSEAWTRRHPIATGVVLFVFLSALCSSGLSEVLDWGPALAITLPAMAVIVAVGTYFFHRRQGAVSRPGDDEGQIAG